MVLERIDPYYDLSVAKLCRFAHIKRYEMALNYIKDTDSVLDAGCGFGYGTELLSRKAKRVVGMDESAEAISVASKRHDRKNIEYVVGDLLTVDLSELGIFNSITCFEVVEHVRHPERIIENLRKNIYPEGFLMLSTPNGNMPYINNPHHVKEYTETEVMLMLEKAGFRTEYVFGQYPLFGSMASFANKIKGKSAPDGGIRRSGGLVSAIPLVPGIFSNLYSGKIARKTSRQLFYVARPANNI